MSNTTGPSNTATGAFALFSNTSGNENTAMGRHALRRNTTGAYNTANGAFALPNNTTGNSNTAIGYEALVQNTTGGGNTAVGYFALYSNTTGSGNIGLGGSAGVNVQTADNVICIGNLVYGSNSSNSCYIGNIFGQSSPNGLQVVVNSNNKLGTIPSSKRFKEKITPMEKASETLFSLKPVSFRYKREIDPAGTAQLGLVAEDVEKVNADLVGRDKEGKPYSVRYDQVNAMLLNEFLKEHKKVQELETTVTQQQKNFEQQQKQIDSLTSNLQRVSAQLEMNKATRTMALNDQ